VNIDIIMELGGGKVDKRDEDTFQINRLSLLVAICILSILNVSSPNTFAYCSASGGCDEYIYGVSLGSINTWATPCSSYIDYSGTQSTAMTPGQSYYFEVVTAIGGTPYTGYGGDKLGIWIDYNGDGDFTDSNELVYSADGYGYFSGTIIVPANANGGVTKMRVRLTWEAALTPCGSNTYGEVEDYGIILPSGPKTRIYGKKWNDSNDNTLMDAGEPALSGWTIFLDEDRDGQIDPNDVVTTTNSQGNYEFTAMEPNKNYYVSELNQPGWINTYPGAGGMHQRIKVMENNDVELNFGNYQLHNCKISGYKFNDANNNGVWNAGEGPLSGWEIYIDVNENGRWDSGEPKTTTNASGYYEFTNLQPGYYNIMEVPQAGWFQTYPGLTSGRLWGLEGGGPESTTIAEVNFATMAVENRFAAPYHSFILGIGCLAAGPSTLFYCPFRFTSMTTVENLVYEIDCQTGVTLYEGVLDMPQNEYAMMGTWHNGILYVISSPDLNIMYLNRYDAITKKLISRDLLVEGGGNSIAGDPYKDVLLSHYFTRWTLYEIDPDTATVVRRIGQKLVSGGASLAYTRGVLYKTHRSKNDLYAIHREDGSSISSQKLSNYKGFDNITGGIGVNGGHRVWIGKRDIDANFGGRLNSEGSFSGAKYEDLNGNGKRDANEPGMAGWPIYVDLDGDMHQDPPEPATVTDSNGNWTIGGLEYGRYFVREVPRKGYECTEPRPEWIDIIEVNRPRDIVFDDLRNLLYIDTEAGKIERYDLGTNRFLTPITVGGSPCGMDITADYGALYVADIQLSAGSGVVHKVNLKTLNVTDLTYAVAENESGSYDIAIGSQGIGLVTARYNALGFVPLHVLDTRTDTITVRPNVFGSSTIEQDDRLVRSFDRNIIWLINNNSPGWIGVYDAPSDTFTKQKTFIDCLANSPAALNFDGSMGAIQLDAHCRIVDSDFNMVMGLENSKIGALFDPSSKTFYQFHSVNKQVLAVDTVLWDVTDYVNTGLPDETFAKFTKGETAITADGRVFAVTDPNFVVLHRKEYYTLALPGRNISQLNFGNKPVLCGDIDKDRDVDVFDLGYLCEDWLRNKLSMDIAPVIRDNFVSMPDLARFANAWYSRQGEENWDRLCDIAPPGGDESIDIEDLKVLTDEWLVEGTIYDSDIAGANGPDGIVNMMDFACLAGNWGVAENIIEYDEAFETGDFSKLPWVHSGDGPWTIVSNEKFQGLYSAKSGDVTRYDESILSVTVTCGEGNVHFMLKNSGDGLFYFWADDNILYDYDGYHGNLDWSLVTVPVTAGTHTFKWSYTPNTYGEVHAWIDAIRFPPANN